jgi:hypothetical protein
MDQFGAAQAGGNVRAHPAGTTILVLGILSLVICGILGPIAWVKGNNAKREMDAQPQVTWTNRGSVTAGRICGIIATALLALSVLLVIILAASG